MYKVKKMHQDWLFYSSLFKLLSWFGITPLWLKNDAYKQRILATAFALVMASLSIVSGTLLFNRFKVFWTDVTAMVLGSISGFTDSAIVTAFILSSAIHRKNWRLVVENLEQFYDKMPKYPSRVWFYLIWFSVATLFHVGIWCTWFILVGYVIELSLHAALSYLSVVVIVFQCVTLDYLSTGYNTLSGCLRTIVARNCHTKYDLRVISIQCGLLCKTADQLNILFGWSMLVITIKGFITPLTRVNSIFVAHFQNLSAPTSSFSWSYPLMVLALTSVTLMSCEALEKSGENFTKTCYKLQEDMLDCPVRRELLRLALYSEKMAPEMTAAGFYRINQRLFAGLFATITTYSIICIQFNIAK